MSLKLVGYRFSPTVQEVLHVIEASNAPVELQNVDWEDTEAHKTLVTKSPTGTFPYLETSEGVLSESHAIENYLAEKYKPELLGQGEMQKAHVKQWVDFSSFEIYQNSRNVVYPIFGWLKYCKEEADKSNNKLKELLKYLEEQLKDKNYVLGENLTLADVALFNKLTFLFQLVFPKPLKEKVFANTNKWFLRMAETPQVKKVYGKIISH